MASSGNRKKSPVMRTSASRPLTTVNSAITSLPPGTLYSPRWLMWLFYGRTRACHFFKARYCPVMFTLAALAICLAAPPENARYPRGQELVYRGQCVESNTCQNARPRRAFEVVSRLFVLETDAELAVATTVTSEDGSASTQFAITKPGIPPLMALD